MNAGSTVIHRRELLRRAAVLLGGSLSAPAMLGMLQGCSANPAADPDGSFLGRARFGVVAEVAEIMIPRTDTPGARDVGVAGFIDTMLANVYPESAQRRYLAGLDDFERDAVARTGQTFLSLDVDARREFVTAVHAEALSGAGPGGVPGRRRPFILMTKELVLLGYFTSEPGATQVLQYDPLPGAYHGCLALTAAGTGRTWATDTSLPF